MKKFMDDDFLLRTQAARDLYHEAAENAPIIDYHCHLSAQEIAQDKRFKSITEVWLGGDHYKWRLMRADGTPERLITGDADDKEKFRAWASVMPRLIGSPLYHWSHLELKKYFGIDAPLTPATADLIYDRCEAMLHTGEFSARQLILRSNVNALCTTDDPVDDLYWHGEIARSDFPVKVLPAWRPDRAVSIEKDDFVCYIRKLGEVSGIAVDSFDALKTALTARMDHFAAMGCVLSDHGMDALPWEPVSGEEADRIFRARLDGAKLNEKEEDAFKTALLLFLGAEYHRRGWVMQLHMGVTRNRNTRAFAALGPDTGFDGISDQISIGNIYSFLDALDQEDALPKTILYSLNPQDNAALDVLIGAFQRPAGEHVAKMQHGSAWWFNDHQDGMRAQLSSLAAEGVLGNFVGMLTDSRSFLSYARHDYFRRILCDYIGGLVENGEYPADKETLLGIVEDICWRNASRYFGI